MSNIMEKSFKNIESPFTELFILLKHQNVLQAVPAACNTDELKAIYQHGNNALVLLLQGLQDLGSMLGTIAGNKLKITKQLMNIGVFISAVANLAEALYGLRSDAGYTLRQKGELDY